MYLRAKNELQYTLVLKLDFKQSQMPHIFLPNAKHSIFYEYKYPKRFEATAIAKDVDNALVFLHHATGAATDWRDQVSFFSNEANGEGFNCLTYDRFGFGKSIPGVGDINEQQQIADDEYHRDIMQRFPIDMYERGLQELADLISVLQLKRIILVGHSDGATLSLLAASGQHSNIINQFKVPDCTLSDLKEKIVAVIAESPHMWFDKSCLAEGFNIFRETTEKTERFWLSTARDHQEKYAKAVVKRWQALWNHNPEFEKFDDRHALQHIECPVMVIHGKQDPFFPPVHSQFIYDSVKKNKGATESEFVLFPESGHTPHREQKELYNSAVLPFLKKHCNRLLRVLL